MTPKTAFVTNAREYGGASAALALADARWEVFCHDSGFNAAEVREDFERQRPGLHAEAAQDEAGFVAAGLARFGRIDALISNDIPRGTRLLSCGPPGEAFRDETDMLTDFEAYLDTLVAAPVRLLRAALPAMKAARTGSIVFITFGAPLRVPAMGGPHGYSAARAATNTLAKTLASELAAFNIQVNAVAPFLLYSQTFFPSEIGAEDPQYAPLLEQMVPMRRFGAPSEMGALIAHLAGGAMSFVSGQVIALSGAGC